MENQTISPGAALLKARDAQGMSQEKVAHILHLPLRFVQAMETDDYAKGPQPAFAKGYLRAYARLVQLSPNDILTAFEALNITAPIPAVTSAALSKTLYEISSIHSGLRRTV
jgi:cytoskeleton protein RodZ